MACFSILILLYTIFAVTSRFILSFLGLYFAFGSHFLQLFTFAKIIIDITACFFHNRLYEALCFFALHKQ